MRWLCSHCGDPQYLYEEQVSTNWFFTQCPHCSRHSLVKKLDVTSIKVQTAPADEPIFHPAPNARDSRVTLPKLETRTFPAPVPVPTSAPPIETQKSSVTIRSVNRWAHLFNLVMAFALIVSFALVTGSGYVFYRHYQARLQSSDRIESTQASVRREERVKIRGLNAFGFDRPSLDGKVIAQITDHKPMRILDRVEPDGKSAWVELEISVADRAWFPERAVVPIKE